MPEMKADYTTPKCCDRSSIAVMDYLWPVFPNLGFPHGDVVEDSTIAQIQYVNRMCMKCHTHWAGLVDNVKQYTGKEWDRYVEGAQND